MRLFEKATVTSYVDDILEQCMDTAVAVPEELSEGKMESFIQENDMEMNYIWMGMWMYDKGINLDREIDKYTKKHYTHSRNASYELLTAYYKEWENRYNI